MNILHSVKCICCLIKCSKYLYFIKKAVCCITVLIAVITGLYCIGSKGCMMKKLKEMF